MSDQELKQALTELAKRVDTHYVELIDDPTISDTRAAHLESMVVKKTQAIEMVQALIDEFPS